MIDGPAKDRKYGNDEKLPWQERTIEVAQRPHGAFCDHVNAVLAGREEMRVTPASVRETMRVLELIRKDAKAAPRGATRAAV